MRVILGIAFFSQWSGNGLVSRVVLFLSFASNSPLTHSLLLFRPLQVSYYLNEVLEDIGITSETIKTLYNGQLSSVPSFAIFFFASS